MPSKNHPLSFHWPKQHLLLYALYNSGSAPPNTWAENSIKPMRNQEFQLTEHLSVLCVLRHNVQHVFGLHDLKKIIGTK